MSFYGSLLLICTIILILVIAFVTEKPPKAPTLAQALKPQQPKGKLNDTYKNIKAFGKEFKNIMSSKFIIQVTVITSIYFSCNDLQNVLIGEIFRGIFNSVNEYEYSSTALEGYSLLMCEIGGGLGGIVAGTLVNKFNQHKALLCGMLLLSITSITGLMIGPLYKNIHIIIPTNLVSNSILGFSISGSYVTVLDMILQHTHPQNPALVLLVFEGTYQFASVIAGEICRILLSFINYLAVFVFMIIILVIALIIGAFLKLVYRRQAASTLKENRNENETLLNFSTDNTP